MGTRLRIGVALSAGGASAMAEVGVLSDRLRGGNECRHMVGAAYAAGRLAEFSATMRMLTRRRVLSLFEVTAQTRISPA